MDSFERVIASFRDLFVDRPPVLPHIGDHAGIIHGLSYKAMYEDPNKAAEAHLKSLDLYQYDIVTIQVEPSWPVAEACGAKIYYPPDKNPWITKHIIETEQDINKLEIPDFMATQSSKVMIDGTRKLAENAQVPVAAYMTGPVTFSLQLMPYAAFFKQIVTNPKLIHHLISKSSEIIKKYLRELREAGAEILVICEHDLQMMPPRYVEEYSLNYLPNILRIYDYNVLHMCGKVWNLLKITAKTLKNMDRLNTINIGPNVDITETQQLFENKIGVAGNIDHIKLLPSGTPKQIENAVHSAIKASKRDNKFIVTPGCEITADTPVDNVKALVKAVNTYKD